MKYTPPLLILSSFFFSGLLATSEASDLAEPTVNAVRTFVAPKIDGNPNDDCWKTATAVSMTITYLPEYGKQPSEKSDIRLLYDDQAIYIGAYLYDSQPDKIAHQLSERDGNGLADDFAIGIDTYDDDLNGYRFLVTAAGVQIDQKITLANNGDRTWDAVWQSAVQLHDDGWSLEIKIPYSAIRFPSRSPQNWGLQFARDIQRLGELDLWSPVDPKISGIINQWGSLVGLENIQPPVRLSLSPYLTTGLQVDPVSSDPVEYQTSKILSGGMDVKWGLNESFTLDATLIPDFGQVQSDNLVLNVSPFETKFDEKRPFFTEGTELFNQDGINSSSADFYSRRIGGTPLYYYDVYDDLDENEIVEKNPSQSNLYNATKISGRTNGGLGIGVLNAITRPTYATIKNEETGATREIETNPITNYNVLDFDQSLKNNSKINFENMNTLRDGSAYDANVSSLHFDIRDKQNAVSVNGFGNYSALFTDGFNSPTNGAYYNLSLNEIKGKWNEWVWQELITPNYNQNDLGILYYSNQFTNGAGFNYYTQEPKKGIFNNFDLNGNINYKTLVDPLKYEEWELSANANGQLKNFWYVGTNFYTKPFYYYDYYEPRVEGRYYYHYPFLYSNLWMNTDNRKKVVLSALIGYGDGTGPDNPFWEADLTPSWIINDHFSLAYDIYVSQDRGTKSFATFDAFNNVIFGSRNTDVVTNTFTAKYAFNPKMNISFRARYYWSKIIYTDYFALNDDGTLGATTYTGNNNINFNVFNIDALYAWEFAPGSFLNVIWKNNIFQSDDLGADDFFANCNKTFNSPQSNGISIKLIYYLDYVAMKKKLQGKESNS